MRKYAVALTFLLVVSGCGGSSDTATPVTTVAPVATQAPTTTVAAATTAAPTTTGAPEELAAVCTFDESVPKISCHAVGFAQSDQLRWESNVSGWKTGASYEVELIEQYQLVSEAIVTLQKCQGSDCELVTTTIDTSAIAQTPSTTDSGSESTDSGSESSAPDLPMTAADKVRTNWSVGNCQGTGSQQFLVAPISPEDIDWIKPLGHLTGAHVIPTSHQKWYPFSGRNVDVRSPVSGYIVSLANRGTASTEGSFGGSADQGYEVQYVIEASCDLYIIIDHVLGVPESISQELGTSWSKLVRIPVSTGELLGQHTDGSKIDIGVVDLSRDEVTGLVRKESYFDGQEGEAFKVFERDSFEYFDEPLQSQIATKSIREAAPRGGFFDYDIDGTAQGSWFREGTNGMMGNPSNNFAEYWEGHLALLPDSQEPSRLRVSIGDGFANEEASVWGVTGDLPRFETITASSGPTSYELRALLPCDGSSIQVKGKAREFLCNDEARGTLLIELVGDQEIRVEVFFNVSPSSGTSFTENARLYLR